MLQFSPRSHGRALFFLARPQACLPASANPSPSVGAAADARPRPRDRYPRLHCRCLTKIPRVSAKAGKPKYAASTKLETPNALSERLLATGLWDMPWMKTRLKARGLAPGEPAPKRKVGRPRKAVGKDAVAGQEEGTVQKPVGTRRRRSPTQKATEETSTAEEKNEEIVQEAVQTGKRVRSKKGAVKDATEAEGKDEDASQQAVKRKRGRPRKEPAKDTPDPGGRPETEAGPAVNPSPKADKRRVHIINEELVDDTIKYIMPTLQRHKGCDLVSVYPGVGLWTKALHDAVQPRSHLLLEPDETAYRPFLQPLLDQEGVRVVRKSGIVWEELDEILTPEYLPNQVEYNKSDPNGPPRNDSLLVNMNLAMYPKKAFQTFDSVSRMVVYQLIQTIKSSTLYQKYGQVRMLIWIPDDEKYQILPRVLHLRRKLAIEGELNTEYIAEVCGGEPTPLTESRLGSHTSAENLQDRSFLKKPKRAPQRWPQMDLESVRLTHERMRQSGTQTPPGRETKLLRELMTYQAEVLAHPFPIWEMAGNVGENFAGEVEYQELLARYEKGEIKPRTLEGRRFAIAKKRMTNQLKFFEMQKALVMQYDAVVAAYQDAEAARGEPDASYEARLARAQQLEASLDAAIARQSRMDTGFFKLARDAIHILYKQPADLGPVLSWDRRPYEPLPITGRDFFPNVPCALLDIQPKALHPLLRSIGRGTDNAGQIFEMMLAQMMDGHGGPVAKQFATLWPGADDIVRHEAKALWDPARGGVPLTGRAVMANRVVNREQMMELLERFMAWPFRPTYTELIARHGGGDVDEDDDMGGGIGDHRGHAQYMLG